MYRIAGGVLIKGFIEAGPKPRVIVAIVQQQVANKCRAREIRRRDVGEPARMRLDPGLQFIDRRGRAGQARRIEGENELALLPRCLQALNQWD